MELTYENVVKWFDNYFKTFNKNAGPLETVPNMQKYFAPDLEFWPYNMPGAPRPSSRAQLLMTMVHPGLHEELTPRYYVVDLKNMIVVVQFQLGFKDEPSETVWPAKQASAHYHIMLDEKKDLKIKKILYWTEASPPPEPGTVNTRALWKQYKDQALEELATKWIKERG